MIIGITGSIGSGKGEVSKILANKGFEIISFGDEARKEATIRGIEPTRENLQKLGIELSKIEGEDFVLNRILSRIQKDKDYAIEGIRYLEDLNILKKREDFILIGIISSLESRWQRVLNRDKEGDPITFDNFIKLDSIDNGSGNNTSGPDTLRCIEMADFIIVNDRSIKDIENNVFMILKRLKDN